MSEIHPLISCICITNQRPFFIQKAIYYFEQQNYPNKELVISYPKKDKITRKIIAEIILICRINIMQIERQDDESLGNARNLAVDKCHGTYVCVWDDDDWYHPSRLSFQYNSMRVNSKNYQASILTRIILYDASTLKAYLSFNYTWDNSLLCRKEVIFQNQYAHLNKGEDTHIIKFLDYNNLLYHIEDRPFLYVYIYHGENVWDHKHFEYFLNKSELLEPELTTNITSALGLLTSE